MSATDIINVRYPSLGADPNLATYLSIAESRTSRCFFGTQYDLAVALRAAHMWVIDTRYGGTLEAGAASSKKEGDLSINFVVGAGQGVGDLDQTAPGKELQDLIKSRQPGISVTGANISSLCLGS